MKFLVPAAAMLAALAASAPAQAATTRQVERKVAKVADNRYFGNHYARCDRIAPRAWDCRVESVEMGHSIGHCIARQYGNRIYVGRIQ